MDYIATITSKRQFTIPVAIFKKAKFKVNQKVLVKEKNGVVSLESMMNLLDKLAGSVKVPKKYQGMDVDRMVEKAKFKRFSKEI